jgi:hypothetical protein
MPKLTTPKVLRQILATPFYVIGLAFNLLSELFTGIAERIDGSSSAQHSAELTTFRMSDDKNKRWLASSATPHRPFPLAAGSDQTDGYGSHNPIGARSDRQVALDEAFS